ncbi:MAG: NAD(P)H:quinone oxidoreductase [Plesiomonas sp.]
MSAVLVLYYSRHGATRRLAQQIARGIQAEGLDVWLRTVPEWGEVPTAAETHRPDADPRVTADELEHCLGLALGSPSYFGQMAAPMKQLWDSTTAGWLKGSLIDKPACVFTSSSSLHGGQEATLLGLMLPLLHHGMLVLGLPYSEPALHQTQQGGAPYGAGHTGHQPGLSPHEQQLARYQGQRLARVCKKLRDNPPPPR